MHLENRKRIIGVALGCLGSLTSNAMDSLSLIILLGVKLLEEKV
jgi:hypothetical protein